MRWLALIAIFSLMAVACSAAEEAAETATDAAEEVVDDATGGDDDGGGGEEAEEEEAEAEDAGGDEGDGGGDVAEVATDFGVTDDTIRVGLNADLTGPFATLTSVIVSAQEVYFDRVNENGGIGGRMVELVTEDTAYDVPTHIDNYAAFAEESEEGVVMLSQSTGSPQTTAIADALVEDDLIAVPLSWYSGWATDIGTNVFELYTNYCFEGMNGIEFLVQQSGIDAPTVAIVTNPGEYGQDSAAGARIAAEALGLDIVVDLEGGVAGEDFAPIISELVQAQPDIVWIASSPAITAEILGGSVASGLTAIWSGAVPTYNPAVIADGSPVAPAYDAFFFPSGYTSAWGSTNEPGMLDMIETISAAQPNATFSQADSFVIGWTEAIFTEAVLEQAVANGDLTRAGVVAAANEVTVDFQGLAPDQTWDGDPNDTAVRANFFYDIDLASATVGDAITSGGSTGLVELEANFIGDVAAGHEFNEPCFVSAG